MKIVFNYNNSDFPYPSRAPLFQPSLSNSKGHLPQCRGVICNMLMTVFSQSYFPVSYGCRIFPRSSSFNFFFQYCLSVFHSIACS